MYLVTASMFFFTQALFLSSFNNVLFVHLLKMMNKNICQKQEFQM